MARTGLTDPSSSTYFNVEMLLNDITRKLLGTSERAWGVAVLDGSGNQVTRFSESHGGVTTNRQVSCNSGAATKITPTADATEMHIVNGTSSIFRYGGTGVTTSTGGFLHPRQSMAIKFPDSDFELYVIQGSGGALNIEVIEFF